MYSDDGKLLKQRLAARLNSLTLSTISFLDLLPQSQNSLSILISIPTTEVVAQQVLNTSALTENVAFQLESLKLAC